MIRRARRLVPALGLLAAAGCARGTYVRIPVAPSGMAATDVPNLARIVVVASVPEGTAAAASDTAGGAALRQLLGGGGGGSEASLDPLPAECAEAARDAARSLDTAWSRGMAGFAAVGEPPANLLEALQPTAVLRVFPGKVAVSVTPRVVEHKTQHGKKMETVYDAHAAWVLGWRLDAWPEGRRMAAGTATAGASETLAEPPDPAAWARRTDAWRKNWSGAIKGRILPLVERRWRRTFKEEEVRSDSSGCYAAWMEAVEHERAGRWTDATAAYDRALAAARTEKDRKALRGYLEDLKRLFVGTGTAGGGAGVLAEPVAIAPFGNDTTNVSAPETVRDAVHAQMRAMGWRVLPLEESDRSFRNVAVTRGESLKAVAPAKVAEAVGVSRWVEGHVDEFKVINVGVYYRRQVRVTLRLRDKTGAVLAERAGVSVQQAGGTKGAGARLLAGLAGAALEKTFGTYLKEDAAEAVREALAYFPGR